MRSLKKVLLFSLAAMTLLPACKKDDVKVADPSVVKSCLGRIPQSASGITFYSSDLQAVYKRYVGNAAFKNVRDTEMWKDLAVQMPVLDPQLLADKLASKAGVPFSAEIMEGLLSGETCGAVSWPENSDEFKGTSPTKAQILVVKPLKGPVTIAKKVLELWQKAAGDSSGQAVVLPLTEGGEISFIINGDSLIFGTTKLVEESLQFAATPRDVVVPAILKEVDSELLVEVDVPALNSSILPTARLMVLEPFDRLVFALSKATAKNVATIQFQPKAGMWANGGKFELTSMLPETGRMAVITSGWNLDAIFKALASRSENNSIALIGGVDMSAAVLPSLNGELAWFFDGFFGKPTREDVEWDSSMVFAFGLKEGADKAALEAKLHQIGENILTQGIAKEASPESPAKVMECSPFKGSESGDVRCYALTDKALIVGYKGAVRRALGTMGGRVAELGDRKELPEKLGGKSRFTAVLDMAKVAGDLKLLAPAEGKEVMDPFAAALAQLGGLELTLEESNGLLTGELLTL